MPQALTIHPVILSGGAGSRLWPLSREHYPKPLLPLIGAGSLLEQTACRLDGLTAIAAPVLVCNEEHRFLTAEQLRRVGKPAAAILLEPIGRNTAPALTLAALFLLEQAHDDVMLVMPADHVILKGAAFRAAVQQGAQLAATGQLVTFGIVPTHAETGYGYIRKGTPLPGSDGAFEIAEFVEKPDAATAHGYVSSQNYFWNSGIFMLKPTRWLEELEKHRPDILRACRQAYQDGTADSDFRRVAAAAFTDCPSDSIDYAVMEKTDRAVVVALDAGWSDIGSWSSLAEVSDKDSNGNVKVGDVLTQDTHNSLLMSHHRLLAAVGIDDMVIVETSDAVLVAHKNHAQDVKAIVTQLQASGRDEHKFHRKVYRPWGAYEGIDSGPRFQVKRLTVNPGASLSLQMHHHRAEHWIVVTGTARVTRGEDVFMLSENQSTYIPLGEKHRLENPGSIPLEIIEVQSGSYLGEDDIVRFQDIYNRVAASSVT
jgi:mannose-1-phosphate guanylyltransferase/mannose-6-phosphate isomerase